MPTLLGLFFCPPTAVGRVGGSDTPLESYNWVNNPSVYGGELTVIEPDVSLKVDAEHGTLSAYLPALPLRFKDGGAIRPVAPFFELWATLQADDTGAVHDAPLTLDLLHGLGGNLRELSFTALAGNQKASFRTRKIADSFTASVELRGDDHRRRPLLAFSRHNPGEPPLVLREAPVPLGSFQVVRPRRAVEHGVDLSVVRVRFTPAKGEVYGPPGAISGPASPLPPGDEAPAAAEYGRLHEIVPAANRILNPAASWCSYVQLAKDHDDPQPADSYDGANVGDNRSWGVVDDTCDAIITAELGLGGRRFIAHARVVVGPPDFAPDRRPFYSCADDLADRDLPPVPVDPSTREVSEAEIVDLFNRVFETVSLMNVDAVRTRAIGENKGTPDAANFRGLPKLGIGTMTEVDRPYADNAPELNTTPGRTLVSDGPAYDRLPLAKVAHFVHTTLTARETLIDFLRSDPDRVRRLIRPPFGSFAELADNPAPDSAPDPGHRDSRVLRDVLYDMRMPPYMRESDETPLSLTWRQYRELMDLVELLSAAEPRP